MTRASAALAIVAAAGLAMPGSVNADLPNNDIVLTPAGRTDDSGITVVGSRHPTITVQFRFGSTSNVHVECSADQGTFTSCGTQVTSGCPASQCFVYTPTFATDGPHRVDGAIFDSTLPDNDPNQPLDQAGFRLQIDSTFPDTRITAAAPTFDIEHETHTGVPVEFNYRTIDDADPILYEDTAQCAVTTGARPSTWVDCSRTLRVPLSTRTFRFWVRAVDFLHRTDPTPAESPPFSAIPCRSQVLSHPRSLRQIGRAGLRIRVRCVQPTRFGVSLQLPQRELIRLNQQHRDITSADLGDVGGRTRTENESRVVTLHLLRRIPVDLYAAPNLTLDLDTSAATDIPSVVHRVTGH